MADGWKMAIKVRQRFGGIPLSAPTLNTNRPAGPLVSITKETRSR